MDIKFEKLKKSNRELRKRIRALEGRLAPSCVNYSIYKLFSRNDVSEGMILFNIKYHDLKFIIRIYPDGLVNPPKTVLEDPVPNDQLIAISLNGMNMQMYASFNITINGNKYWHLEGLMTDTKCVTAWRTKQDYGIFETKERNYVHILIKSITILI